ncbi:haloalkane dehalogenase [Algimonas ampicilliniresistens]|uniref:Haloalkane dehalogenase n=1 Tax=Algimonas ampicilliniresistens TaxID=1298735 RepID=A0ABQ5V6W3_9PROT|nr:haloalkane dehalogenase [Algimonas ampicilliniresistens]GLQ23203.1 haloalkane dehalogenase [Algimonas ampicilliniresistens]
MEKLRTPDERFNGLPDYPFEPNYATVGDDLRLHYVDEGAKSARPVLMMHGEPSWSFLYRHMIPPVAEAGFRVIAPDLIGFGKSDKPTETSDYSYSSHVEWMLEWFDSLDLSGVVLFCQDWGGLIGLRLVAARPDRFAAVIAGNTMLPIGEGTPPDAFLAWQQFSQTVPEFPTGMILQGASVRDLTAEEVAGYDAPYPDESFKAGARIFPALVPTAPDHDGVADNRDAWKVLSAWDKPFVTCFSDQDPVTKGGDKIFQARVPGTKGQPHRTIKDGGHFLQEDQPGELAELIIEVAKTL